jgi:SAM-dependent methyltransferase
VGYIFRLEDAGVHDDWINSGVGKTALSIQKDLLERVWAPAFPQSVLEVGSGTGLFLEWFSKLGHQVTGLEPSQSLLESARKRLPERIALNRGFAEHLPYDDNEFDTVALITTLEFVEDPEEALREALRVARRHVLLGVHNKYSLMTGQRLLDRFRKHATLGHARLFSVFELQRLTHEALSGPVPLRWRTCISLPLFTLSYTRFIERAKWFQCNPFGRFIAMRIDLTYPLQTIQKPLFTDLGKKMHSTASAQPTTCWHISDKQNRQSPQTPFREEAAETKQVRAGKRPVRRYPDCQGVYGDRRIPL